MNGKAINLLGDDTDGELPGFAGPHPDFQKFYPEQLMLMTTNWFTGAQDQASLR